MNLTSPYFDASRKHFSAHFAISIKILWSFKPKKRIEITDISEEKISSRSFQNNIAIISTAGLNGAMYVKILILICIE